MKVEKIHHVAYRCNDAHVTVEWYGDMLNMDFVLAIAEDHMPSTGAFDPCMHAFLDAGMGNVLALPEAGQGGSMLELSQGGSTPLALPNGERRTFLEDGDTGILRGYCKRPGLRRIGFGECAGTVLPARLAA